MHKAMKTTIDLCLKVNRFLAYIKLASRVFKFFMLNYYNFQNLVRLLMDCTDDELKVLPKLSKTLIILILQCDYSEKLTCCDSS